MTYGVGQTITEELKYIRMNGESQMDKKLKQALCDAYYAPATLKKEAFLKRHPYREVGHWHLITLQIKHIQWWIWGVPFALLGLIFFVATWPRAFINKNY